MSKIVLDAKHAKGYDLNVSDAARAMGRKGGKARKAALTPQRRAEIAKAAAVARWGRKKTRDH